MISNTVKNKRLPNRTKGDNPDSHSLQILVRELQETLFPLERLATDLIRQFSGLNQDPLATPEERNARRCTRELTQRELEILQLLAKGKNNPEIAEQLFISRGTVEQHRKHINYKLKIKSLTHLMHYGYAFDLV